MPRPHFHFILMFLSQFAYICNPWAITMANTWMCCVREHFINFYVAFYRFRCDTSNSNRLEILGVFLHHPSHKLGDIIKIWMKIWVFFLDKNWVNVGSHLKRLLLGCDEQIVFVLTKWNWGFTNKLLFQLTHMNGIKKSISGKINFRELFLSHRRNFLIESFKISWKWWKSIRLICRMQY